ncbi:MAG: LytTR family DNA-binding domain-containing protein [Synoicihabitans sp.]
MTPIRTLIIEDNPIARMDLIQRLEAHPEIVIIGQTDSVGRARPILAKRDYDLVFLDIDLRGTEAFELIPDVSPTARIIFVTAHNEHAVRAFEVNAFDYLLKPVEPERLAQSIARLQQAVPINAHPDSEPEFQHQLRNEDQVYVRQPTGSILVPVAEISAVIAAQNYTELWLIDGTKLMVRRSMKEWEEHLNDRDFVRAARDTLVSIVHIERTETSTGRGAQLWLKGKAEPVSASFRQWPAVKSRLGSKPELLERSG